MTDEELWEMMQSAYEKAVIKNYGSFGNYEKYLNNCDDFLNKLPKISKEKNK